MLATEFFFVNQAEKIVGVADDLTRNPNITAVGVVDDDERVVGILVRKEFFTLLMRPYGRDVFHNRDLTEIMTEPKTFYYDTNLFTIAEEIAEEMKRPGISYFVLTNAKKEFKGIFSTQDMLIHLSNMTQMDIALARKLQSRMVKERELVVGTNFEFVSSSTTAKGVGGDYYSIKQYAEKRWVFAICDVSGKGVAASVITSVLWGMMNIFDFHRGIGSFVKEMNDYIVRSFEGEKFVTGLFLDYREETQEIHLCDMGHSYIYVFRDGKLHRLKNNQDNPPIGVIPDIEPKLSSFRPRRGDTLLLTTDGLVEQVDMEGNEYSVEKVAAILENNPDVPVESLCDKLNQDFEKFRGPRHLHDDVTFSIIRFVEQDIRL